nr:Chain B, Coactivator peptide [synthetic construct]
LLRYLLDKDD